jgi:hypothetical protein
MVTESCGSLLDDFEEHLNASSVTAGARAFYHFLVLFTDFILERFQKCQNVEARIQATVDDIPIYIEIHRLHDKFWGTCRMIARSGKREAIYAAHFSNKTRTLART